MSLHVVPDPEPVTARFLGRTQTDDAGCWIWQGALGGYGYGCFQTGGKRFMAHRWAYERWVGPIPDGLQIDHLCRVTACVNPAHLEAVTARVNVLRSTGVAAVNALKTTCLRGHPFDHIRRDGKRGCHTCKNADRRRFNERKKAQRASA